MQISRNEIEAPPPKKKIIRHNVTDDIVTGTQAKVT